MEPIAQKETEVIKLETAANRLVQSQCMQKVLECLAKQVLFPWLLTSRRFFLGFIPPVITALSIFAPKLLRIFENSSCVEIFSHTCLAWGRIIVCAANHTLQSACEYFKGKSKTMPTYSKIMQLSNSRFIITGGSPYSPCLVAGRYKVGRSTLVLFLDTASFAEKPLMTYGRR
jgi:hypothetical protein